jgi:hypothetical protein
MMRKLKILAAAAALLVAAPLAAQEMGGAMGPGRGSAAGPEPTYSGGHYNGYNQDNGFWAGEVAGDAVGAAAETAGAVATAPFRALGSSNAMAQGPDAATCAQRYRSYDPSSGTYMGYDGSRHACQ